MLQSYKPLDRLEEGYLLEIVEFTKFENDLKIIFKYSFLPKYYLKHVIHCCLSKNDKQYSTWLDFLH